jgi:hypothetical protein
MPDMFAGSKYVGMTVHVCLPRHAFGFPARTAAASKITRPVLGSDSQQDLSFANRWRLFRHCAPESDQGRSDHMCLREESVPDMSLLLRQASCGAGQRP